MARENTKEQGGPRKTKASTLTPEDCECCTPSMAGAVLGRLSRTGGISRKSGSTRRPTRVTPSVAKTPGAKPTAKDNEIIDKVALRAGLYVVKASWKPQQTAADAVFFDLGSGELVGYATAQEMFDEARRLEAKRSADGALLRWTPPVQWFPTVRRTDEEPAFWRVIDNTWPYHYAAIRIEDWGSGRGRGKRVGTMVTGAMSDPPRGKKVYLDVLAHAGFSREDREVLGNLGPDAELRAARGLFVGLGHADALTLGFVGVLSSESLTREQAFKALRWTPRASHPVGRGGPAKASSPGWRMPNSPKASAKPATAEVDDSVGPNRRSASEKTVGIDVLLEDLDDVAKSQGRKVERKHVAKALRQMLYARHKGFTVRVEGAKPSTLEVVPGRGERRFKMAHRRALHALFDDAAGGKHVYTVLISRSTGDGQTKATGIRIEHANDFRRRVAEAAGFPKPPLYAEGPPPPPRATTPSNVTSTASGLSTDELVRIAELLLSLLHDAGIVAQGKRRLEHDDVVIDYGQRHGVWGHTRMHVTPAGMNFVAGAGENPDNVRTLELFMQVIAPLVSHGKPDKSANVYALRGLPRGRRTTNLDAKARELETLHTSKALSQISVVDLPPAEAANSRPTAVSALPSRPIAAKPAKPASSGSAPVRMDHVLRDIKEAAKANGGYVERKHVAKALRVMLQARRLGLSVTTPSHSFASTLDIKPSKGASRFGITQNAALRDVFGEDAGRSNSFMVLVTRFVGNADSVPTGIRPERIDAFRAQVAKAAGLPKPVPFAALPDRKAPPLAPSDRMDDTEVLELVGAFVGYASGREEAPGSLQVRQVGGTIEVETKGGALQFSVIANLNGFSVLFGESRRLGELFLETFAAPMRGEEKTSTKRARIFAWAPKAKQASLWDETMERLAEADEVGSGERLSVGRVDHEDRRDARVERLRSRAGKARSEAKSRYDAAGRDLPPMGEPIKIGHHSEGRHRRALDRAHANLSKWVKATQNAKHLDARADAAESNAAISSDDPRALERLHAKLERMETEREELKRKNRLARKGKLPNAENPLNPVSIRDVAGERRFPMPGYALKNLGAEIRRVRERIEMLSKRQGRAARSLERGDARVVENGELNRLQIFTGSKPPSEARTWLKRNGFRWARSEGAWQRQIGDGAWNDAMHYLDTYVEKRDDTPYGRVEASIPKPKHTEADLEFWHEEFAQLDAEFPGEGFDLETQTKVIEALRARRSGHPGEQAAAYGEYRAGRMTLEEAVALMYRYGRYARPKLRPKRPRKLVTSSMGRDAFVAAVKERGAELGQLFVSNSRSGVYFTHYNVPKDVKDDARRENNRLMLSVEGWERDGAPPKDGKVKLEVVVSTRLKGLRGRTSTPEAMVGAVAEMLRRHSALESV